MGGRVITVITAVLGVIGLALLGFESVQALRGQVIGTTGTAIMYAGVGVIALAGIVLAIAVSTESTPD
jgi:uncharacterized membrane protein